MKSPSWLRPLRERLTGRPAVRPSVRRVRRLGVESLEERTVPTAGALDPSFGGDGRVLTDIANATTDFPGSPGSVVVQPDGKILVVGRSVQVGTGLDFAVVRYNPDGSLDTTFDGDGKRTIDFNSTGDAGQGVAVQPDGKIVVAGYSFRGGATGNDFAVARLNPDGGLDTSFDGDGRRIIHLGSQDDIARSVAVQPDGRTVVAGFVSRPGNGLDFAVARLNPDGSLDTSFDGDGKRTVVFGSSGDQGYGVAVQPDGRILVAGHSYRGGANGDDFAVARLNPDGSLDTSFGDDGMQTIDFGGTHDIGTSVALQSDGSVLVAGNSGQAGTFSDFAVCRLLGDETVSFNSVGQTVNESDGVVAITASLTGPVAQDVLIPLTVVDATAGAQDFVLGEGRLVIPAGKTTGTVEITVFDDQLDEDSEVLTLVMGTPSGIGAGAIIQHTVTIVDNDPLPGVTFSTAAAEAAEGAGDVQITARLTEVSGRDVTIPLTLSGSLGASDYTLPGGHSIIIPAGATEGHLVVRLTDDATVEPIESLVLRMLTPTNAVLATVPGVATTFTLAVPASDAPTVSFTMAGLQVQESVGQFTVTARLSAPHYLDVTVPVTTTGTATVNQDYTVSASSILIPAGQTEGSLVVTVINDSLAESAETVYVTMGTPGNALLGATQSLATTIAASDVPIVSFATAVQTIWEGESANVVVTLSNPSPTPVAISLLVPPLPWSLDSAGRPTRVQVTTLPQMLSVTIPANQLQASIALSSFQDTFNTASTSVYFTIASVATNGTMMTWPVGVGSHKVTVRDNDPYISFAIEAQTVGERGGTRTATINLSAPTNQDVSVTLGLSGKATKGKDYTISPSNGRVVIPAGQTSATVSFTILDDSAPEVNETMVATLETLSNALIAMSQSTRWIPTGPNGQGFFQPVTLPVGQTHTLTIDDDDKPTVGFSSTGTTVTEKDSNFTVTITATLSAPVSDTVTVNYTMSGTAANTSDVTPLSGTITISPGSSTGSVTITVKGDKVRETTETVTLKLSKPTKATLGTQTSYKLTIKDNDPPPPPVATPVPYYPPGVLAIDLSGGAVGPYAPVAPGTLVVSGTPGGAYPIGVGVIALDLNGYMSGGTVFFDGNKNGVLDYLDLNGNGSFEGSDVAEPVSLTGVDGRFEMTIPEPFDQNGNGVIDPADGHLVAVGGVDITTGLARTVPHVAPGGSFVATPLTTLMVGLVDGSGMTLDGAQARVLEALGLPADIDLKRYDPVTAALAGDPAGLAVFAGGAKVQNTVLEAAHLIAGVADAPPLTTIAAAVAADMAEKITEPGSALDLSDPFVVEAVLQGAASRTGVVLAEETLAGAAVVIAAGNQAIDAIAEPDPLAVMAAVSQVKVVARATIAARLAEVGAGQTTIAAVVQTSTGDALQAQITAAVAGDMTPPILSASDGRVIEGAGGEVWLEFAVAPDRPSIRPVSVDYTTADHEAAIADGDYEAASGALTWAAGDVAPKTVRVRVMGDARFETDEAVVLMLSNPTNALLGRDIGTGVIANDDALTYVVPSGDGPNQIGLRLEGDGFELTCNDEVVYSGVLSIPVPLTVVGADGVGDALTVELVSTSSVLAGGLAFHGGNGGADSLTVLDGAARAVTHTVTAAGAGTLVIDGAVIAYDGTEMVTDGLAAGIAGIPADRPEGMPIDLTSMVADIDVADVRTYEWLVMRDGATYASGTGRDFRITPNDNGVYTINLTVTDESGAVGTTVQTMTATNVAPTAAIPGAPSSSPEGAQITLGSSVTDPGAADTHTYSWSVTKDGSPFASETGAGFSFTPDDDGSYVITLTVTDDEGGSDTETAALTVTNVAPTASILSIGPVRVEGTGIAVEGAAIEPGALDTLIYSWQVFKDGGATAYAAGSGASWSFTPNDNGSYRLELTVTDKDGGSHTADQTVAVDNVAPVVAALTGPAGGVRGQTRTFAGSFADPGSVDTWTATIDFGDGTGPQPLAFNPDGTFTADHVFAAVGSYTITVAVADDDGGVGTTGRAITVSVMAVQDDPNNPGSSQLVVGGSTGNDHITVTRGLLPGSYIASVLTFAPGGVELTVGYFRPRPGGWDVELTAGGSTVNLFAASLPDQLDKVVVYAQDGHDDVKVSGFVGLEAWLFGGGGNDRLQGGGGNNVVVGGVGDDLVVGGAGRDLLIGGAGADRLVGNQQDDILVAGSTAFDANVSALGLILAEWTSGQTFAQRVANLGGAAGGANGGVYLVGGDGPDATVSDDDAEDVLTGNQGTDWFVVNLIGGTRRDKVTDWTVYESLYSEDIEFLNTPAE